MAKILIVDDDPDFVAATRKVLEREGHVVSSAANGDEALQQIAADQPDLILLDVIMTSVLEGLTVSRQLGTHPAYRQIPIIMITSIANVDYAELFPTDEQLHLDTFLTKPIPPERLIREVNRLLAQS